MLIPLVVSLASCVRAPAAQPASTVVMQDLERLLGTLEVAYPRALVTEDTWATAQRRLKAVAEDGTATPEHVCGRLADALRAVPGAEVRMPGASTHCGGGAVGGPMRPDEAAAPSGDDSTRRYVFEYHDDIAVLGIRHFAGPTDPGWAGTDAAFASAATAEALIVDLQGSGGQDVRAVWPLVERLAEQSPLTPLVAVDAPPEGEAARRAHTARFGPPPRNLDEWRDLVGPHVPPTLPAEGRPPRQIMVLVDQGCGEACQLVARTLETYARAVVRGTLGPTPILMAGQPALLELPETGIEVLFPGAAFVLNPSFDPKPSYALAWHSSGQPREAPDALREARIWLRSLLDLHARVDRWRRETPVPCAKLPGATTWHALPESAQRRITSAWHEAPRTITVTLELPLERATEFLAACPGVRVVGRGQTWQHGQVTTLGLAADRYADVARIAQSDAVALISIEGDLVLDPLP